MTANLEARRSRLHAPRRDRRTDHLHRRRRAHRHQPHHPLPQPPTPGRHRRPPQPQIHDRHTLTGLAAEISPPPHRPRSPRRPRPRPRRTTPPPRRPNHHPPPSQLTRRNRTVATSTRAQIGRLMLGQRRGRVVLRDPQTRARPQAQLAHPSRRPPRPDPLDRGLVQPPPSPLDPRLPQPHRDRDRLVPSTNRDPHRSRLTTLSVKPGQPHRRAGEYVVSVNRNPPPALWSPPDAIDCSWGFVAATPMRGTVIQPPIECHPDWITRERNSKGS
jgi:hypothetical protein